MYQWISWHQPGGDYRPLTYPPNSEILGWWCSGHAGKSATLCALVRADDESEARALVLKDWPEAERWRFCEPRDNTNVGDRFKPSDWMIERMSVKP